MRRGLGRLAPALVAGLVALAGLTTPAHAQDPGARERGLPASVRSWIQDLPPDLRAPARERLRRMPERRRRAFVHRFERMSEGQRAELAERLVERHRRWSDHALGKRFLEMTPRERRRFRAHQERWREMPAAERQVMRQRLERFRALSPVEQETLVERSFPDAGPAERARKLEQLRAASRALPPPPGGAPGPDRAP